MKQTYMNFLFDKRRRDEENLALCHFVWLIRIFRFFLSSYFFALIKRITKKIKDLTIPELPPTLFDIEPTKFPYPYTTTIS